MEERAIRYRRSDAWLLLAIESASHHCDDNLADLGAIGAYADGIMHTHILDSELESGLVRLTAGGWIYEVVGKFACTEKYKSGFKFTPRQTYMKCIDQIATALGAEPYNHNDPVPHPANNLSYPGYSAELRAKSDKRYHKQQRKAALKK